MASPTDGQAMRRGSLITYRACFLRGLGVLVNTL